MLVWQDMPNGGIRSEGQEWKERDWFDGEGGKLLVPESESNFDKELREIMDTNHNFPSICVWVPFNGALGQFPTRETAEWMVEHDPSRLINTANGNKFLAPCSDILALHNYPLPNMDLYDPTVVNVMGHYGGIGYGIPNHQWNTDKSGNDAKMD
jgi:hypothetical protein